MSAAIDFYNDDAENDLDAVHEPRVVLRLVEPGYQPAPRRRTESAQLAVPVATKLRLTVRGRLVIAIGVIAVGLGLLTIAHFSIAGAGDSATGAGRGALGQSLNGQPSLASQSSVLVQSGDTLWSIAQRLSPTADPRNAVARLRQLNHLASVELSPGEVLRLR